MSDKVSAKSAEKPSVAGKVIDSPMPTHFLAREGDKYTPLIPLDELPEFISVVGVPTYVTQEELLRLKGTGCFPVVAKGAFPYTIAVQQDEVPRRDSIGSDDESAMNVPSNASLNVSADGQTNQIDHC